MSNQFYVSPADLAPSTKARAGDINTIDQSVDAAFDKLPTELALKTGTVNFAVNTSVVANAYAVTLPLPASVLAYPDGLEVKMRPVTDNTAAATLNVNGLGNIAIKRQDGTDALPGDLVGASNMTLIYSAASNSFRMPPLANGQVKQAADSAAAALASANAASTSAGNAAGSRTAAGISEANALTYAASALASKNAAATSEANVANKAPLASPALTGRVTINQADNGVDALQVAGSAKISGTATLGIGGTGAANAILYLNGASGNNAGALIIGQRNGVVKFVLGSESADLGGNTDNLVIDAAAAAIKFYAASAHRMQLATSGALLVGTQTDNGTDLLQVNGSANVAGSLAVQKPTSYGVSSNTDFILGGTDNGFVNNGAVSHWRMRTAGGANGQDLLFSPYVRGSGFGATPNVMLTATGRMLIGSGTDNGSDKLQVTGNIFSTGAWIKQNTPATVSQFLAVLGSTTATTYGNIANTGGSLLFGVESSAGQALFLGTSPYATVLGSQTNTSLQFATQNNVRMTINGAGVASFSTAITTGDYIAVNLPAAGAGGVQGSYQVSASDAASNEVRWSMNPVTTNQASSSSFIGSKREGAAYLAALTFGTQNTERARIDSNGNLLLGLTGAIGNYHSINKDVGEGPNVLSLHTNGFLFGAFAGVGAQGWNNASTALFLGKHSSTARSISAGGTINASGADYAEYMHKAAGVGDIAKGAVVGVTAAGELTDKWADAVSFMVKTTNPSYVGGDTWGSEEALGMKQPIAPQFAAPEYAGVAKPDDAPVLTAALPVAPAIPPGDSDDAAVAEFKAASVKYRQDIAAFTSAYVQYQADVTAHLVLVAAFNRDQAAYMATLTAAKGKFDTVTVPAYQANLVSFNAALEAARAKVDRIAYAGQVPVNVQGAQPGQFIVAIQSGTGIAGKALAKASLTLEQYINAVGIVQNVLPDGRANIRVKVA